MARPSIDYLNARRGVSRGAIRPDRMRNAVDERARDASRDAYVQGDPRGAALYVGQYNPATKGADPQLFYTSGVAVFQ